MASKYSKYTNHQKLIEWITQIEELCTPKDVVFCDGSKQEHEKFLQQLVDLGVFVPLNPKKRPGSYWCASDPNDVARVEERTFICSEKEEGAGPTNHWRDPKEMKRELTTIFKGCMQGRTMYVIPFSMGPYGSSHSLIGVQITDSLYVAVNNYIMTRMGKEALKVLGDSGEFIPCVHSVGVPLKPGEKDVRWPCRSTEEKYIVQFPEERSIWSFGSGYGGNALLGKKCLALRIASAKARDEGWLAEHMLILGLTSPEGKKKYIAAAFPSACGKTNLAMMTSALPGWKTECVGDDIAWMQFGKDGKLYAINPENGYFGVAPGTSDESNPIAMETIKKNCIFTNVALTEDKDVWWEGIGYKAPGELTSWKMQKWKEGDTEKAAHPNSRFTAPASQCPIVSPEMNNPEGVPISAIIFGGRRPSLEPLVYEAYSWKHGTFFGAALSSEMTAAAKGKIGELRHDPFAMLPFCGYNMGDYFQHWLDMEQEGKSAELPKFFHVNWFRKNEKGEFLWPGFGDNARVLKWIFDRCDNTVDAVDTPLGLFPKVEDLEIKDLGLSEEKIKQLFEIDKEAWKKEIKGLKEYFLKFGDHLPKGVSEELNLLEKRLE